MPFRNRFINESFFLPFMENKHVGYLVIGIAVLFVMIILLFNSAMKEIISLSCGAEHSVQCPMNVAANKQTYLSLGIVSILFVLGFVLIFTKPKEKVIVKKVKIKERKKNINLEKLEKDERKAVSLLLKEGKAMFQADLMDKLEIGKVKTTRLLDKLEAKGILERKRRGMNNIVVLKS